MLTTTFSGEETKLVLDGTWLWHPNSTISSLVRFHQEKILRQSEWLLLMSWEELCSAHWNIHHHAQVSESQTILLQVLFSKDLLDQVMIVVPKILISTATLLTLSVVV